ncbi:MAG: MFS transporter [Acidobacteria bacterium]|jgi:MFS family permease|nr:MFS transporter [Acidobacteriota bacterium]
MSEPGALGPPRRDQGLALTTAFLSLFSIVGVALYGLPFFYDFFVTDLGWTRQQVTSGNALSKLLVGPLFGFLAGVIVDRFGPRRLMLAGIAMAGLALVGLGGTTTLSAFYFFYLFNALGYVCGGPLPNQVLLSRLFDKGRGKAMGFAYLGIGIGGMLVPLLAYALIEQFGWRLALRLLGALIIVLAFPAAFFVREPPAEPGGSTATAEPVSIVPVLKRPAFYLLALGSMASIGAIGGTIQNMKLYLALDKGMAQGLVAQVLSLVLAGSIGGRILMGWLADRWPRKRVMLLVYLIVAGAIPLLAVAPTTVALKAAGFLFGVGLGGDYMIIPLMAADLFGLKVMGRLMGIVLTADGVAEALVPMAVATIRDHTGTYTLGFVLLVALAALGAIAVTLLPSRGAATTPAPARTLE